MISKEVDRFFKSAIEYYSQGLDNDVDESSLKTLIAFLYSHYLDFLMIDREYSDQDTEQKIVELRHKILEALNSSQGDAAELINAYIKSFNGVPVFTKEDLLQVVRGFIRLRKEWGGNNTPDSVLAIFNNLSAIKELLKDENIAFEVVEVLLNSAGMTDKPLSYCVDEFPVVSITMQDGVVYTFDLIEGELVHTTLPKYHYDKDQVREHPLFSSLVRAYNQYGRTPGIKEAGDHCKLSGMCFYPDGTVKEKKGIVYAASCLPQKLKDFYPPIANAILWVPLNRDDVECHLTGYDYNAPLFKSITRDGLIRFDDIDGEWEPLEKPKSGHPFLNFDPYAVWTKGTGEKAFQTIVLFPLLTMRDEKPLVLVNEKGVWFIQDNPDLIIAQEQTINGLNFSAANTWSCKIEKRFNSKC